MKELIRDDQYTDLRDCATVSSDVKKYFDFAIAKGCDAPLVWYGVDAQNVAAYEPDTLSFDRTEKEGNTYIKQTEAGTNSIEIAKEIELELNYSHRFIQALIDIFKEDALSMSEGALLTEMSNGWIWFRETRVLNEDEDNEYIEEWVFRYLKVSEMTVPFTGLISSEAVCALSFLVEKMPRPNEYGVKPKSWALPTQLDLAFSDFEFDITMNSYVAKGDIDILYTDIDGNYKTYTQIWSVDEEGVPTFISEEILSVAGTVAPITGDLTLTNTYGTPLDVATTYYIKVGVFFNENERFYINDYVLEPTVTP